MIAMERFEEIFQAKAGSAESDEADVLSLLLKEYEEKHYVIGAPLSTEWNNKDWQIVTSLQYLDLKAG